MQTHTFIPESQAAAKLNYKNGRTLRRKVTATGCYEGQAPLPITFTTGGKGYLYSLEDINRYLLKTSSK